MLMDSLFDGHTTDSSVEFPFVDSGEEVEYYPWNDGVDYTKLCRLVRARVSKPDTYYIISSNINGGIGHKYLSIFYSLTYAILLERRFLSNLFPPF